MKKIGIVLMSTALFLASCAGGKKHEYPIAQKDSVVDDYYGVKVADPYRWLENDTSAATLEWVEQQRKVTDAYLSSLPGRDEIRSKITALMDYEKIGAPSMKNGKYYYFRNSGLQNQSVLYCSSSADDEGKVLLDPNTLSEDGTVALQGVSVSEDGKYLAYTISRSGSDWVEIYVKDIESGKLLDDHIMWAKFSGADWYKDGFYYSAYDAPVDGKEYSNKNEYNKVYYHKLGTPQSSDVLVYKNDKYPLRFYSVSAFEDAGILVLYESGAGAGNGLYYRNIDSDSDFSCITDSQDYSNSVIDIIDGKMFIMTNRDASNYKLVVADVRNPKTDNWKDVLPETENVLSSVSVIGDKLVAVYDKDAANHAYVYDLNGKLMHEVKLPSLGTVYFSGNSKSDEAFYTFTSFTYPATVYRYDINANTSEVYRQPYVPFNPEDYVTEQVFFTSKDGTKVPMSLTYKKGIEKNGNNPVYVYGYGGFSITLYPAYRPNMMYLLDKGFIYAQTNLRGGNEYGEAWHQAGTKMNKQNVFDDFIGAVEYLIDNNYTNPELVVAEGGSNGGLLIGACVNQRPDLFRVAIPRVGVMDMLRYHKFTIGWNWAPDYGTSEDSKEMFEYLKAYSPIHNIKNDGTQYPAILVTTADHDDRVVPAHSFKYAATLQASDTGDRPKYIRIDSKAGHGAGKPTAKVIDEYVDMYSFILENLKQ